MFQKLFKSSHQTVKFSRNFNLAVGFTSGEHLLTLYFLDKIVYDYNFPMKIKDITFSYSCNSLVITNECFVSIFNIFNKKIEFTFEDDTGIERAYLLRNGYIVIKKYKKIVLIDKKKQPVIYDCDYLYNYKNKIIFIHNGNVIFLDSEFQIIKKTEIPKIAEKFYMYEGKFYYYDGKRIIGDNHFFKINDFDDYGFTRNFFLLFINNRLEIYTKVNKFILFSIECDAFEVFRFDFIFIKKNDVVYLVDLKRQYNKKIKHHENKYINGLTLWSSKCS